MSSTGIRRFLAAVAVAAAALAPRPAAANGRYPAAGLYTRDPSSPLRAAVRTTFGLLVTDDAEGGWGWVCEQGIGFSGEQDPMVVLTPAGNTLAGLFEGLARSADGGCDWGFLGGELEARYVTDLAAFRGDGDRVVALTSNGVGVGVFDTRVWLSLDGGQTFSQLGVPLPDTVLGLTLDVAPSDPDTIWVSGRYPKPTYQGALLRTTDAGASWQSFDVPGSNDTALPYIGAIHPADPDEVYVRLDADPADRVVVTRDGGASFEPVFEGTGALRGFALSPDGAEVAIGGDDDGVLVSPTSAFAFEARSPVGALCLTWYDDALFACADESLDGFTVGRSIDGGQTFEPILLRKELCGPLACPDGSTTKSECATKWGPVQETIGAACPSTGGAGGGGSGGQGGGGGGCACSAPGGEGGSSGLVALGLAALFARRRAPARGTR